MSCAPITEITPYLPLLELREPRPGECKLLPGIKIIGGKRRISEMRIAETQIGPPAAW